MKKILSILSISLILFACNNTVTEKSTWTIVELYATSLNNNILNDTTKKEIAIYLPPSYSNYNNKKYPVIYYLGGYDTRIDKSGFFQENIDSLIKEKQTSEFIFVNISGQYLFNGSFYVNSPISGNWEDFVVNDIVNHMDENYRTLAKKESRALIGMSMGGYGVLNLAMLHPEIFANAYAMSPGLFDENGLKNSQMFKPKDVVNPILELIEKLKPLSKSEADKVYKDYIHNLEDWRVEFTLAYGVAFAPNTAKAPYFDYPLSVVNNDTITNTEIWNKWESGFGGVNNETTEYSENLNKLNLLAVNCGYNDDFRWITDGTLYYSNLLSENKISHNMVWHQGTHGSLFVDQFFNKAIPTTIYSLEFE